MLSVKTRQKYLKELGYYTGKVDGIEGKLTKQAYKTIQKDYFTRKKDIDGIYGKNTDILLNNVYIFKDIKYFKLEKFKCQCEGKYCTGYPVIIDKDLINNIDDMRKHFNIPFVETSGFRCKVYNDLQKGSSKTSRHLTGKALDFYTKKGSNIEHRKELINYWINHYKESRYGYSKGYYNLEGKTGKITANYMGNSVHVDVK